MGNMFITNWDQNIVHVSISAQKTARNTKQCVRLTVLCHTGGGLDLYGPNHVKIE